MNKPDLSITEQLAKVASALQLQRTGHAPNAVTVILSEDTLVVTLHDALSPAEKALARSPEGAAQVQEFHRRLFANSTEEMRKNIKRLTGRDVREATAEIEPATGTVIHAFATGAMVQVFLLAPAGLPAPGTDGESRVRLERAEDDGLRVTPAGEVRDSSPSGSQGY